MKHEEFLINKRAKPRHSAVLIATVAVFSQGALSHEAANKYEMSVISNQAHGAHVVSGNFDEAIEQLSKPGAEKQFEFSVSNNLCVAYTLTGKIEAADAACEKAVTASIRFAPRATSAAAFSSSRNHTRDKAMALSNRGVFRALNGDQVGAEEDFSSAIELRQRLKAPSRNLALLQEKTS